jgi:hypothetical protein
MTFDPGDLTSAQRVQQYAIATGAPQAVLGRGLQNNYFGTVQNNYSGAVAMPLTVAARDPEPVYTAVNVMTFTGREWLVKEIDQFIAMNPCGYIFVAGEAGVGKTAFAAWLIKTRGYLSHFSRYSDGQSAQAALQNLAAQLVLTFKMGALAPDGMLPAWAQTPAGFGFLLSQAAEQARASGRPLVLIVDGLDEAESADEGLPFGLPKLLPAGVYVVGTHRTGWSPGQPDAPAVKLGIQKDDPRNAADIGEFLAAAAAETLLAAHLAEAGVEPRDFIRLLSGRCDGVWIYLRYVLHELRIGLRRIDAIGDLPTGLLGYYADHISRWQADPSWQSLLLPLLATLGAAAEPLTALALSRLAGDLNVHEVRQLCDTAFRPLLTASRTGPTTPLKYEIYHSSFRQVLRGDYGDAAALPFELEALGDELYQVTIAAHSWVADTYLQGFGGLDAGLPELAAKPAAARLDDGYPLRHLAGHLHHAGRIADLHRLLAISHPLSRDRAVNVWFAAHDAAGRLTSYLGDLADARQNCAAVTDLSTAHKQHAPTLSGEIRYMLMATSIASRSYGVSPQMIDLLIGVGMWSPERGLDHVRHLPQPAARANALLAIHHHMPASARSAAEAETMDAALAISDESQRADVLVRLALQLPAEQREPILARALDGALVASDFNLVEALAPLAPYLTAGQLARALDSAITLKTEFSRAQALTALAPYLTAEQLARALDAAITLSQENSRAQALAGLAPHLTADQARSVIDIVAAMDFPVPKAETLATLAGRLSADEQSLVLDRALSAAMSDGHLRASALTGVVPHLPVDQQPSASAYALYYAAKGHDRLHALAKLAPYLGAEQLPAAVDIVTDITDAGLNSRRAVALASLAPRLTSEQLDRALDLANQGDSPDRASTLASLAAHLDAGQLPRALEIAAAIGEDYSRAEAVASLAPHLNVRELARALEIAVSIGDATDRAWTLTRLAPHALAGERSAILTQALDAGTAIGDDYYRARVLASLATRLPAAEQPAVLAQALATAAVIGSSKYRSRALASLVTLLPVGEQPAILAQALTAATAIGRDSDRAAALASLAPHLDAGQLSRALDAATGIGRDSDRAAALASLAPHLDAGQLSRALDATTAISEYCCVEVLASLAPHLDAGQLSRALDIVGALDDNRSRAEALAILARHLSAEQQTSVTARAMQAAAVTDNYYRAEALAAVARYLPAEQQQPVVAQALNAIADTVYSPALVQLAPYLNTDQLRRALDSAAAIDSNYFRSEALTGLIPFLPADLMRRLIASLDSLKDGQERSHLLAELASHLPADQMSLALDAAMSIGEDWYRGNAISSLAPHLPADQLSRALSCAIGIKAVSAVVARSEALHDRRDEHLPWNALRLALTSEGERSSCLCVIEHITATIAETGGVQAIRDCIEAVNSVYVWWP